MSMETSTSNTSNSNPSKSVSDEGGTQRVTFSDSQTIRDNDNTVVSNNQQDEGRLLSDKPTHTSDSSSLNSFNQRQKHLPSSSETPLISKNDTFTSNSAHNSNALLNSVYDNEIEVSKNDRKSPMPLQNLILTPSSPSSSLPKPTQLSPQSLEHVTLLEAETGTSLLPSYSKATLPKLIPLKSALSDPRDLRKESSDSSTFSQTSSYVENDISFSNLEMNESNAFEILKSQRLRIATLMNNLEYLVKKVGNDQVNHLMILNQRRLCLQTTQDAHNIESQIRKSIHELNIGEVKQIISREKFSALVTVQKLSLEKVQDIIKALAILADRIKLRFNISREAFENRKKKMENVESQTSSKIEEQPSNLLPILPQAKTQALTELLQDIREIPSNTLVSNEARPQKTPQKHSDEPHLSNAEESFIESPAKKDTHNQIDDSLEKRHVDEGQQKNNSTSKEVENSDKQELRVQSSAVSDTVLEKVSQHDSVTESESVSKSVSDKTLQLVSKDIPLSTNIDQNFDRSTDETYNSGQSDLLLLKAPCDRLQQSLILLSDDEIKFMNTKTGKLFKPFHLWVTRRGIFRKNPSLQSLNVLRNQFTNKETVNLAPDYIESSENDEEEEEAQETDDTMEDSQDEFELTETDKNLMNQEYDGYRSVQIDENVRLQQPSLSPQTERDKRRQKRKRTKGIDFFPKEVANKRKRQGDKRAALSSRDKKGLLESTEKPSPDKLKIKNTKRAEPINKLFVDSSDGETDVPPQISLSELNDIPSSNLNNITELKIAVKLLKGKLLDLILPSSTHFDFVEISKFISQFISYLDQLHQNYQSLGHTLDSNFIKSLFIKNSTKNKPYKNISIQGTEQMELSEVIDLFKNQCKNHHEQELLSERVGLKILFKQLQERREKFKLFEDQRDFIKERYGERAFRL
ncbi:hypothetical protein WICMUC_002970 [Wickerhamomyces mucosus]|uniref:Uncharacterized protein n=1 Tax=Wickerhamomyces mucosus TaxID=1378264 RepID=A0A9P8PMP0_9ASCO|nr:hypothetical protein WICMUC_002970 [Wickerhamomyces mucosus]